MRKTYRASVLSGFYFSVLSLLAVLWFILRDDLPNEGRIGGILFLVIFGVVGVPILLAHVTIDDSGIQQRFFARHYVSWEDVISWRRLGSPDGDCPDTIIIETRQGPFRLNGNCIFGSRLAEVEAELRRRVSVNKPHANRLV
jgi:hypothetical protein